MRREEDYRPLRSGAGMNGSLSQDFVWPDKFGRKENLRHDNETMLRKEPSVENFRLQDNSEVNKGVEDREENCRMSTKSKLITRKSSRTASINKAKKKLALEDELKKLELEMKKQEIQYALKILQLESEYRQEEVESGAEVEESVEEESAKHYEQYYDTHMIRQWARQSSGEVDKPEGEQTKPIKEETSDSRIKMLCDTINEDTEDDQTCLEEFQECLKEYQECLEVIHIGVDDDTSFNTSSCTSRSEEQYNNAQNKTLLKHNNDAINIECNSIDDSDLDVSYKSTNNTKYLRSLKINDEDSVLSDQQKKVNILNEVDSLNKQSDKIPSDHTEMLTENLIAYTKCLKEYYYDIQDCMKAFMDKMGKEEMFDDDIFNNIILPFDSRSAPNVMDRSFVMTTYDPGISIAGEDVDLRVQDSNENITLSIFVKSVVPKSPAGKTGRFKTGDRILEVNGKILDQASHEEAVHE